MLVNKRNSNWPVVIGLLLAGAVPALPGAYIAFELLQGPPADGSLHPVVRATYFDRPAPILTHALSGIVFAALMPFQFAPGQRRRGGQWHRLSGRMVLFSAYSLALSAFWMIAVFDPTGGPLKTASLAVTGFGMIATFTMALVTIRAREPVRHRAWMMRGVAVTYGAVPAALVTIPLFILFGELPQIVDDLSRWLGLAASLAYTEWLLGRGRRGSRRILARPSL